MSPDASLPTCIDSEMALVGALITNNDLLTRIPFLTSEHFAEEAHGVIFEAVKQMAATGKRATPISLKPYLGDTELAPGVTAMKYMADLVANKAGMPAEIVTYAEQVRDFHGRRAMILSARKMIEEASKAEFNRSLADMLRDHEDRIEVLRPKAGAKQSGFTGMRKIAERTYRKIQDEWNNTVPKQTLRTGYAKLDEVLGGLEAPNLIVIGGRPASGKTSLAVDIAVNGSVQLLDLFSDPKERGVVAIFSMEMSDEQVTERIFARQARVTGTRIKRRKLFANEVETLYEASRQVEDLPIEIDHTGGLSVAQICARARALHRRQRIRLLVVDYLQLIKGNGSRQEKRHEELGAVMLALKELCKELEIPCVLISQVSRDVDKRENKRPMMADLGGSSDIENNADAVLLIYREEGYLFNERPMEGTEEFAEWEKRLRKVEGIAEVIIGKSRFGARGTLLMGFDGPHTTFLNDPPERQEEPVEARRQKDDIPPLSPYGKDLLRILEGLVATEARRPNADDMAYCPQLPKAALMVSLTALRTKFKSEVMFDADEKTVSSKFQAAITNLKRRNETSAYTDMNSEVHVFLHKRLAE
jgi:replicative DNA helicase